MRNEDRASKQTSTPGDLPTPVTTATASKSCDSSLIVNAAVGVGGVGLGTYLSYVYSMVDIKEVVQAWIEANPDNPSGIAEMQRFLLTGTISSSILGGLPSVALLPIFLVPEVGRERASAVAGIVLPFLLAAIGVIPQLFIGMHYHTNLFNHGHISLTTDVPAAQFLLGPLEATATLTLLHTTLLLARRYAPGPCAQVGGALWNSAKSIGSSAWGLFCNRSAETQVLLPRADTDTDNDKIIESKFHKI